MKWTTFYICTTYENSSIMISKIAVKNLLTNKTLGPNNFNAEFHQLKGTNNSKLT